MSSDDVAIRVSHLSKRYLLYRRPEDRLKQSILPRLQRLIGRPPAQYFTPFDALHDVSFEIKRGETIGIVGRNGSGKSTLLQLICGTLQPTGGEVSVRGRLAALLELGAGFNADFTGRENVFMNGAILGLTQDEVRERYDDILRFADIGPFIDQPVKTYSSGMVVRLAFAVAVCVSPDILIVDEALSVGDEAFQRKCFARIEEIQDHGGTILFVSHSAQAIVQLCTRAILIDSGEKLIEGSPKQVVSLYQRLVNLTGARALAARAEISAMNGDVATEATAHDLAAEADEPGQVAAVHFDPNLRCESTLAYEPEGAEISDVRLTNQIGQTVNVLEGGETYRLHFHVAFTDDAERVVVGGLIKTISGLELAGFNTTQLRSSQIQRARAGERVHVCFQFVCRLTPGTYLFTVGVAGQREERTHFLHRIFDALMFRVAPAANSPDYGYFSLDASVAVTPLNAPAHALASS